jgi:hypothetical protein
MIVVYHFVDPSSHVLQGRSPMQILPPSKWWRNPKSRRRMAGVVAVIAAAVGIPAIVAANGQPGSSAGESSLPVEVAYASPGTASG